MIIPNHCRNPRPQHRVLGTPHGPKDYKGQEGTLTKGTIERDRRPPFAVEFDQPCIKPNCDRDEAKQFLEELLLRETIEEPDEGDLVGKVKPVMRAPALAELHEIFLD
jgi:hypothetical protein